MNDVDERVKQKQKV